MSLEREEKEAYLMDLVRCGEIDRNCRGCQEMFIPRILSGVHFTDIFAPRHKPSINCKSGKRPHCTCDTCF